MTHVDGNALAGAFARILGIEITTAIGRCRGCGRSSNLARAHAFVTEMGTVMRCGDCQDVLAVVVHRPGEALVSLTGLSFITLPTA